MRTVRNRLIIAAGRRDDASTITGQGAIKTDRLLGGALALVSAKAISTSAATLLLLLCYPSAAIAYTKSKALPQVMCNHSWTDPQALGAEENAESPVFRFGAIASIGTATYLVGDNIPRFGNDRLPDPVLSVITLSGSRIGAPYGGRGFAFPIAAVDGEGRLQVIWGETGGSRVPATTMDWALTTWERLWTATYTPGRGWTAATRFFDSPVNWGLRAASRLLRGRDGRLYFAFATLSERPSVVVAVFGERWTFHEVWVNSVPAYIGIALSSDRVFLAIAASDLSAKRDANSVFISESSDDGRTFSSFRLVARAGENPAHDLQLLADSAGVIHLIWKVARQDGSQLLRHTQSNNGGTSWVKPSDTNLNQEYNKISTAIDRNGCIHVIAEAWNGGSPGHLRYTRWSDGWGEWETLFGGVASADPVLGVDANGGTILVFARLPISSQPAEGPLAMYARMQ